VDGFEYSIYHYSDNLYRLDASNDDRPYSEAPYKFFTATEQEAISGYSNKYQMLRIYHPERTLVLLNMFDTATRAAIMDRVPNSVRTNIEGSFPYINGDVNRVSTEDEVQRNYNVIGALCNLFAESGIDGYYVPRSASLHSEIAICGRTLREGVLKMIKNRRVAPDPVVRRPRAVAPPSPVANRRIPDFQSQLMFANAETENGDNNLTVMFSPPPKRVRYNSPTRRRDRRHTRRRSQQRRNRSARRH
jgi:hypothetical protein